MLPDITGRTYRVKDPVVRLSSLPEKATRFARTAPDPDMEPAVPEAHIRDKLCVTVYDSVPVLGGNE